MAGKVYISEYADMKVINHGIPLPVGHEPCLADQTIVTSAASAASAAFNASTKFVRVHAATIVSIAFGAAPVATTNSKRMNAGESAYFAVEPGQKMAAIDNT